MCQIPGRGFGSGGQVLTDFITSGMTCSDEAMGDIAVQPNNNIIAVGVQMSRQGDTLAMARYKANGTLDSTFGTGGKVTSTAIKNVSGVALQADGKFVVVGGFDDFAIARFNANGTPGTTFGAGGFVSTDIAGFTVEARAVAIQPDGNIVVAGRASTAFGRVPVVRHRL